jgi:pyruvate,water dikinase
VEDVLRAVVRVYASLFMDRAIHYRKKHGIQHPLISVGVQKMVRSSLGTSGVMFSIDTESGHDQLVFITASYGLGETIVQGTTTPDEFYVFKPSLTKPDCNPIVRRVLGSKQLMMCFERDLEVLGRQEEKVSDEEGHAQEKGHGRAFIKGKPPLPLTFDDELDTGDTVKLVAVPLERRRRFCLTSAQVAELARVAVCIEKVGVAKHIV